MYYYRIYGLNIKTDYKLEEAYETHETISEFDIEIKKGEIPECITKETEDEQQETGKIICYYEPMRGWVRAPGHGSFVMENGDRITYKLKKGYNPLIANQVFLCVTIPVLLIQRGIIAIHGSGILWGEKAIIVSGKSGSGKSSLTAELLRSGGVFMADDTVALSLKQNKIFAQPAYPQQKLCPEALTEESVKSELVLLPPDGGVTKYAVRLKENFCMEEKELEAIVILNTAEITEVQIQEITGSEKIKYLTENLYKYKTYLKVGMSADTFRKCVEIANKVKVYILTRPKKGMTVTEQMEKLNSVLKNNIKKQMEKNEK